MYNELRNDCKILRTTKGGGIMKRLGVIYGIYGGVLSYIAFSILQNLTRGTDAQSFIFIGTIILSAVICFCTGMLIETYKNKNEHRKDL
jgi:hypothetical protein